MRAPCPVAAAVHGANGAAARRADLGDCPERSGGGCVATGWMAQRQRCSMQSEYQCRARCCNVAPASPSSSCAKIARGEIADAPMYGCGRSGTEEVEPTS